MHHFPRAFRFPVRIPKTLSILCLAAGWGAASAQMPSGPYSSWSQAEIGQAAGALKQMCGNQCSSYTAAAAAGSQRATYEAAACVTACYVNNLPDDYPNIEQFKRSAMQNYQTAKQFGSNAPVFLQK
jgi:hypothetical protein